MLRHSLLLLFLLITFASGVPLCAQEVQYPVDLEGRIDRIDQELEGKIRLFTQVRGFREVFLFRLPDSSYVLEVWYHQMGRTMKERHMLSPAAADSFRTVVTREIKLRAPLAGVSQAGRGTLIGNMYALALGLYGWGIPYVAGLEDEAAVGTYLLCGAGGILITYSATREAEISLETAHLTSYGAWLGVAHGVLFHAMIHESDATPKGYVGSAMIGGVVEGIAGFMVGDRLKLGPGAVEMLATSTALGLAYGYGTAYVTDISTTRGKASALLGGSLAGMLGSALLIGSEPYSAGDAAIYRTATILGAYLPLAVHEIAGGTNPKTRVALTIAGGISGGLISHQMMQGKDFPTAEGNYVSFGTIGGALVGLGISALASAGPEFTHSITSIGATIGFAAMYSAFAPEAQSTAKNGDSALRVDVSPAGLVSCITGRPSAINVPFVMIRYRF